MTEAGDTPQLEPGSGADPGPTVAAYSRVVWTLDGLIAGLRGGGTASLLPLHRAMQAFVMQPTELRPAAVALSITPVGGTPARLAMTGALVALCGQRLGLGTGEARDMGVTAALVSIGRAFRPDLADAPTAQCGEEGVFEEGLQRLILASGSGRAAALRLIVAAELATAAGRAGGHPLTRLVAVADAYVQLVVPPPAGRGLAAAEAVQALLDLRNLDQEARRLLILTIGLYPVGSAVKLSNGASAIVVGMPTSWTSLAEPRVVVFQRKLTDESPGTPMDLVGSGVKIDRSLASGEADLDVGHFSFA